MDMITLAAARKYVNDTAIALGAVKGSPCTIKSITETDDGATVVFSWTGADGVEQTSSTFLPRGPQGLPGEKGEPGAPGKDGSGTVDTVAREQITALTEEIVPDLVPYNLPMLYLTGDISPIKESKENEVTVDYVYGERSGTCKIKGQGASSYKTAQSLGKYGKYNYTIKFDNAFEAKEGWGAQKKYCFKANFIDHSHARNIVSCKLWGQSVRCRSGVPDELYNLPNGGAIDGFPCIIMLNGEFHGLYTWNIPKDGWMFGAPKAILCADDHTPATQFKALATLDGDFELEYVEDEENADWVLPSINRAIQAVIDSQGGDLYEVVDKYIDVNSAIDYYVHTVFEGAADATDKNYILVTFDGVKWYFSSYDRDTTYGLDWDGKRFFEPFTGTLFETFAQVHRLMGLLYLGTNRIYVMHRAEQLANSVLSDSNVLNVFTNFVAGIPSDIYAKDTHSWPKIPSTSASDIWQIVEWYRVRRQMLDAEVKHVMEQYDIYELGMSSADYEKADSGKHSDNIFVDTYRNRLLGYDEGGGAGAFINKKAYNGAGTYLLMANFTPEESGKAKPTLLCRFYGSDGNVITGALAGWEYLPYYKAYYVFKDKATIVVPDTVHEFKVGFVFNANPSVVGKRIIISNPALVKML